MNHLALNVAEQSHIIFWLKLLSSCCRESATTPALSLCTVLYGKYQRARPLACMYVLLWTCSQLLPWKQTLQRSELLILFFARGCRKVPHASVFWLLTSQCSGRKWPLGGGKNVKTVPQHLLKSAPPQNTTCDLWSESELGRSCPSGEESYLRSRGRRRQMVNKENWMHWTCAFVEGSL